MGHRRRQVRRAAAREHSPQSYCTTANTLLHSLHGLSGASTPLGSGGSVELEHIGASFSARGLARRLLGASHFHEQAHRRCLWTRLCHALTEVNEAGE
jgi:hypothetical protein